MSKELDDLKEQHKRAVKQCEVCENREERIKQKIKYVRSAKDRKRTHRLIQYGAAFECNHKELAVLTDEEIYSFVESLLEIPEAIVKIQKAVANHKDTVTVEGSE